MKNSVFNSIFSTLYEYTETHLSSMISSNLLWYLLPRTWYIFKYIANYLNYLHLKKKKKTSRFKKEKGFEYLHGSLL